MGDPGEDASANDTGDPEGLWGGGFNRRRDQKPPGGSTPTPEDERPATKAQVERINPRSD